MADRDEKIFPALPQKRQQRTRTRPNRALARSYFGDFVRGRDTVPRGRHPNRRPFIFSARFARRLPSPDRPTCRLRWAARWRGRSGSPSSSRRSWSARRSQVPRRRAEWSSPSRNSRPISPGSIRISYFGRIFSSAGLVELAQVGGQDRAHRAGRMEDRAMGAQPRARSARYFRRSVRARVGQPPHHLYLASRLRWSPPPATTRTSATNTKPNCA